MKKTIILIAIMILFIFSYLFYNNKNIEKLNSQTDSEIRLRCITNTEIDKLTKKIKKEGKVKTLFIDNVLCSEEFNKYDFDKIKNSVFWLKLNRLIFFVWWKYLDNIEDILKKTSIKDVDIWICRKEWEKITIYPNCLYEWSNN